MKSNQIILLTGLLLISFLFFSQPKAETVEELLELQKITQKISEESVPKTVLVRGFDNGRTKRGAGSGAIISEDGYILTCAHVIGPTQSIEVVLSDGTIYEAEKLGYNERNDYCLLKINATNLPFFELGNSDSLRYGEWTIAIGHPGGANIDRDASCSIGQITALHAKLPAQYEQRYYGNAIKSDTPIFSGNSGGPLVDLEGKLIGLNAAILLHNEDSFTVPINEIKEVLHLLKAGKVLRGYGPGEYPSALQKMLPKKGRGFVGISTKMLQESTRYILGIPDQGVVVKRILRNSPAAKSKLREGDIILAIEDQSIKSPYQFNRLISSLRPYTTATFYVLKGDQEVAIKVAIGRK